MAGCVQLAKSREERAMGKPKKSNDQKTPEDLTAKDATAVKGGATAHHRQNGRAPRPAANDLHQTKSW